MSDELLPSDKIALWCNAVIDHPILARMFFHSYMWRPEDNDKARCIATCSNELNYLADAILESFGVPHV